MTDGVSLGVAFAMLGGVMASWGIFTKLLHASMSKRIDDSNKQFAVDMVKLEGRLETYYTSNEKMRDRWDVFLTDYLKIDSTRGQKIDALFRVIDQMQDVVRVLPKNMNSKIEESFTHSLSELKLYVRELMAKELPHGSQN